MSRPKLSPNIEELTAELTQSSNKLSEHFSQAETHKIREAKQKQVQESNIFEKAPIIERRQKKPKTSFDISSLISLINNVYSSRVKDKILVRCSPEEREIIRSFLESDAKFISNYPGVQLSASKLYRFALQYMIENHKEEFLYAMQESLSNIKET